MIISLSIEYYERASIMQEDDESRIHVPALPVVFLDVDTQKDFILPDGYLSIKGAESITPNLAKLSKYSAEKLVFWIATMDSHILEDPEISSTPDFKTTFPPHCMRNSAGVESIPETLHKNPLILDMQNQPLDKTWSYLESNYDSIVLKKNNIDMFSNKNFDRLLSLIKPKVFVVFGVATDFCVKLAVKGLLIRNFKVVLVKDAVYAIDQNVERRLLDEFEFQGVKLMTTDQVINLTPNEFELAFR
jgi:nicotinamidase/pyrazinamidase